MSFFACLLLLDAHSFDVNDKKGKKNFFRCCCCCCCPHSIHFSAHLWWFHTLHSFLSSSKWCPLSVSHYYCQLPFFCLFDLHTTKLIIHFLRIVIFNILLDGVQEQPKSDVKNLKWNKSWCRGGMVCFVYKFLLTVSRCSWLFKKKNSVGWISELTWRKTYSFWEILPKFILPLE